MDKTLPFPTGKLLAYKTVVLLFCAHVKLCGPTGIWVLSESSHVMSIVICLSLQKV